MNELETIPEGTDGQPISTTPVTNRWKPPLDIMTEAAPLKITDERIGEIAKDLGTIGISGQGLRALRDLGCVVQGVGVIRMAGGGAAVTHLSLIKAIMQLSTRIDLVADKEDLESTEMLTKLAHSLGFLSGKLAAASLMLAKSVPDDAAPSGENNTTRKSFTPGAVVQINNYPVAKPHQEP